MAAELQKNDNSYPENCSDLTKLLLDSSKTFAIANPNDSICQSANSIKAKQLSILQTPPKNVADKLNLMAYYGEENHPNKKNMTNKFRRNRETAIKHLQIALGIFTPTPKKSTGRRGVSTTIVPATPEPAYSLVRPSTSERDRDRDRDNQDLKDFAMTLGRGLQDVAEQQAISNRDTRDFIEQQAISNRDHRDFIEKQVITNQRQREINESFENFAEEQMNFNGEASDFNRRQEGINERQQGVNNHLEDRISQQERVNQARFGRLELLLTPPRRNANA